jgi:hypothetical protein
VGEEETPHTFQVKPLSRELLRPTLLGQHREHPPPIARTRPPFDEAELLEARDDAGDSASGEDQVLPDLGHTPFAPRPGEVKEDLEFAQAKAGSRAQVRVQPPGHQIVSAKEPAPGRAFRWGEGQGGSGHWKEG